MLCIPFLRAPFLYRCPKPNASRFPRRSARTCPCSCHAKSARTSPRRSASRTPSRSRNRSPRRSASPSLNRQDLTTVLIRQGQSCVIGFFGQNCPLLRQPTRRRNCQVPGLEIVILVLNCRKWLATILPYHFSYRKCNDKISEDRIPCRNVTRFLWSS